MSPDEFLAGVLGDETLRDVPAELLERIQQLVAVTGNARVAELRKAFQGAARG
jgi:hypothetical protein